MHTRSRPVAVAERVDLVDALRGFALAGVFFINLRLFSMFDFLSDEQRAALPTALYDDVLLTVAQIFGDGKFISLFSMLFGLGFALQLQRLESRGAKAISVYRRRATVLLAIGVIHGLLWFGDILRYYGAIGLALLFVRHARTATLTTAGIVLALGWAFVPPLAGADVERLVSDQTVNAFSSSSFVAAFRQNLAADWFFAIRYPGLPIFIFGRFLLGYVAGRIGLVADSATHVPLLQRLAWLGWVSGFIATIVVGVFEAPTAGTDTSLATDGGPAQRFFEGVNALGFAVAYACTFVLLCQRDSWRDLLNYLAPVGRMCLTNYLLQTLVSVFVFYGWGLGIGPRYGMPGVIVAWMLIYGAQVPLSRWWLHHYHFGPAEWLWRSLTYGERQPFRVGEAYNPRISPSTPA